VDWGGSPTGGAASGPPEPPGAPGAPDRPPPPPSAQVEYAIEAINQAGSCMGILAEDGVVLVAEKKITSKLLDSKAVGVKREKMYQLDGHIACSVAGITSDANILISSCRLAAQRYLYQYQEPIPVEQLVRQVCDRKQAYTQFGGQRPFGASLLFAGWDKNFGFQLYQSDPAGNYGGWKATAIGANHQTAQNLLKQDFAEGLTVDGALELALRTLTKTMDSTNLTVDKVEIATLSRDPDSGDVAFRILDDAEIKPWLDKVNAEKPQE